MQEENKTAKNVCVFLAFGTQVLRDSLTPPTARLQEQEAIVLSKKTC